MRLNLFSCLFSLTIITALAKSFSLVEKINLQQAYETTSVTTSFFIAEAKASAEGVNIENKAENLVAGSANPYPIPEGIDNKANADEVIARENSNLISLKLSAEEIKLLKELSKRRDVLDKYEQKLTLKESMLSATETKLEQKMVELKALQTKVDSLLKQHQEKENQKIRSLAKIYSSMKPKEAAKIFEEMDMPMLIEIVRNINEAKVAPIIASLTPAKAKELSLEFARHLDTTLGENEK